MKYRNRLCSLVALFSISACGESESNSNAADAAAADGVAPTALSIDAISAQETPNGIALEVAVSVSDDLPATVTLTAESSDQDVLADSDIALGGQSGARTLTLTPQAAGLVSVTVTATDADGDTAATIFELDSYFNRLAWVGVKQWDEGAQDSAEGLDVGPNGDVWIAGHGQPALQIRTWLKRIDLAGTETWTAYHDAPLGSVGRGVAVFPDQSSIIASQAKVIANSNKQFVYLGAFAASGGSPTEHELYDIWADEVSDGSSMPSDIAGLADGSVATSIQGFANTGGQVVEFRRLAGNAEEVFTTEIWSGSEAASAGGVAASASATIGAINTQGTRGSDTNAGDWDGWVVYLDASGAEMWSAQIGTTEADFIGGVAMDDAGNVYVCGQAGAALDPNRTGAGLAEVFVAKYNSAGVRQWLTLSGSAGIDGCVDISVGRNGVVYAAGSWNFVSGTSSAFVAAYGVDGTELWVTEISASVTSLERAGAVIHSGRDIIVTGYSNESFPGYTSTDRDAWLARLSEDGVLQ